MFEFRIIELADGNQIIDRTLKTPYDSLTPLQMLEYIEIDSQLYFMEQLKKKQRRQQERRAKNPLWKLACLCGIV